MRSPWGALLGLSFGWLAYVLFREARMEFAAEVVDGGRVILLFAGVVIVALIAGTVLVVTFIPLLGDWVGNFFFNPHEHAESSAHTAAREALARGDYPGAAHAMEQAVAADPHNHGALVELARIHSVEGDNPIAAAEVLEEALTSRDWTLDQRAELNLQLAEVYWSGLHDASRARKCLQWIVDELRGMEVAMQARTKLQEIDSAPPRPR